MKERPILFSAPMVRAILEGRKTQTRRIVKGLGDCFPHDLWPDKPKADFQPFVNGTWACAVCGNGTSPPDGMGIKCPYGGPGDRLWVRETWSFPVINEPGKPIHIYRATDPDADTDKWRPSIHMPRYASRINLEITGVRVERLHDISEADALREGMTFPHGMEHGSDPKDAFRGLWSSINGADSWDANPWVWVVESKRVAAPKAVA